ncbi:MAG: hypothetical protein AB7O28_06060 [Vicinamibacterales bacterium]
MKAARLAAGLLLVVSPAFAQVPPPATQIAGAVLAAPEDRRAAAKVLGWDGAGALVTLREGTNDVVCLADNPKIDGFNVACYHKDLDPFMARGRQLTAQGITDDKQRDAVRWKEVDDKKLSIPQNAFLTVVTGTSFDAASGQVADAYTRWVVYVPYATAASTGLGTRSLPGVPWLMDPGTAGAHIMISPVRPAAPRP